MLQWFITDNKVGVYRSSCNNVQHERPAGEGNDLDTQAQSDPG
jgi:hypothetical protein